MPSDPREIAAKLTKAQAECIVALLHFAHIAPYEPNTPEVAREAGHPRYWAAGKLAALAAQQLARAKHGRYGGTTWRITNLGREVAAALLEAGKP